MTTDADPFAFTDDELEWLATNDPAGYADVVALMEAELQDRRAADEASQARRLMSARWGAQARATQLPPDGDWWVWLILAGRGWGKALDEDTSIPTPTGWKRMGDLRVGDHVLAGDGTPTPVTFVTGTMLDRPCYRIRFSDGAEMVADAEHQWSARSRSDRRAGRSYRTVTTLDMLGQLRCARERNWQMPAAEPLELPEASLLVAPYTLGVWLGDGTSSAGEITVSDVDREEMLELLAADGTMVSGPSRRRLDARCTTIPIGGAAYARGADGRMTANGSLHSRLRALGVLRNKHLPPAYLRASRAQREALLAGLIDTDGYVEHATGCVEITTVREPLAEQIAELARTLGHRARILKGRATLNGVDVGPKFRVVYVARDGGGRLARKRLASRHHLGQPHRIRTRYVDTITAVPSRPVRCITVAHPTETYLAGRDMCVTHNTRTGAEWAAAMARRYPGCRIALVAPTAADGRDTMVEGESGLLSVIADAELRGGARDSGWNRSLGELFMANGSRFKVFSAEKPSRLRGPQHHFVWADEPAVWGDAHLGAKASPERDTTWSNLALGLRNTAHDDWPTDYQPRAVATTTPKPVRLLKAPESAVRADPSEAGLMQQPGVVITAGRTDENLDNLAQVYVDRVIEPLRGTRLGMQELDAILLEDDGESILRRSWWRFHYGRTWHHETLVGTYRVAPTSRVVQSWDMAFKDLDTSDFVVGQVWEFDGATAYLLDQVRDRMDFTATCAAVQGLRAKWPQTGAILVEDKANGTAVMNALRRKVPGLLPVSPHESKSARASAVSPFIEAGNVFLPEPGGEAWVEEFIEECVSFPRGAHDDQVDAMTQALARVFLPEDVQKRPDDRSRGERLVGRR